MNIGINARHLIENKLEGIGWYSFEVLRRLVLLRPQDNFYFFYDRKTKPLVESVNLKNVIVYPSARHPILFKFWFLAIGKKIIKNVMKITNIVKKYIFIG